MSVRTEAEILARALEIGALSVEDAVAWALLREVPGRFDETEVRGGVLRILADGLRQDGSRADQAARSLYQLAITGDLESLRLKTIAWWAWDGLDMADAGMIQQTREQVIDELIAAPHEAAPGRQC